MSGDHVLKSPCPACGAGRGEFLYRQAFSGFSAGTLLTGYDVVACARCGLCFADDLPDKSAFGRYYAQMSKYEFTASGGVQSPHDLTRFEQIAQIVGPLCPDRGARVVEIGSSTGGLLARLRGAGYRNLLGVDPSPACARAARELYDIEVLTRTLDHLGLEEGAFDLVLLIGVLEHLPDAATALADLRRLLAPGGLLYLEVPDALRFREFEDAPFQEFSTEHILYFTPVSLANLMGHHGFRQVHAEQNDRWYSATKIIPNISAAFRAAAATAGDLAFDREGVGALRDYVEQSSREQERIEQTIDALVASGEPLFVWGVGTHTQRLLETTAMGCMNIVAFVDSNARYHDKRIADRPIVAPEALTDDDTTVLISSRVFQRDIREMLQEMSGDRKVLTFYDLDSQDIQPKDSG